MRGFLCLFLDFRLSEANCIEVVTKLISRGLIDVVFTRDGKSYVTNKHLETEVGFLLFETQ